MRYLIHAVGTVALIAFASPAVAAAAPAAPTLNGTTWTFTDQAGTPLQETIDTAGNYVLTSGAQHIDHGVMVMKADKACFTSAMTKEGEVCWKVRPTAIGESIETVSDKGQTLTVTRVAYVPLPAPASK